MVTIYSFVLATIIVLERIFELILAARNRKKVLAMGAQEFGHNHYPLLIVLHVGWFTSWLYEACSYGTLGNYWHLWMAVFLVAEVLRYWCILSLGKFWNTRIFVVPGERLVRRGPYRLIPHPNYLAVALVLLSVPLIFGAWRTSLIFTILNAMLLLRVRIPVEEQALKKLKA